MACLSPKPEHGIDEWSWFPRATDADGQFVFGKSTEPLAPVPQATQFHGEISTTQTELKSRPAYLLPMVALPAAPLQNPKPGTFNTVGVDQVIATETKQYCRQASIVLSIDAGTGYLSRTGTISYNSEGRPVPAENTPRRIFDRLFSAATVLHLSPNMQSCRSASSWLTPWLRRTLSRSETRSKRQRDAWIST